VSARGHLRASLRALALAAVAAAAPARAAEIALSFHDAPGGSASGFRIERRAAGGKTFTPIALVGPGVVEFVDRSAGTGQLLCYRVRALASRSASDWSTEVCASAREPAPAVASGVGAGEAAGAGGEAAAATSAAQERRVRAGGGWLQVLE
jgi:hypothetical protein